MSDNTEVPETPVLSLIERRQAAEAQQEEQRLAPIQSVITGLENLLTLARRGELRSLIALGEVEYRDGTSAWRIAEAGEVNTLGVIGHLELVKAQYIQESLESRVQEAPPTPDAEVYAGWELISDDDRLLELVRDGFRLTLDSVGRVALYQRLDQPDGSLSDTVLATSTITIIGPLSVADKCTRATAWADRALAGG